MICQLCDKPFEPKRSNHTTYCCPEHSIKARKILDAYVSNRLDKIDTPRGIVLKVLKNYNIPTFGVNFDDRGNSRRFGANHFDK